MLSACRNPFLYSGHFNEPEPIAELIEAWLVAIPSFIQGISTCVMRGKLIIFLDEESQSLPLFRAFQQVRGNFLWCPPPSRNPFLYSGHFNSPQEVDFYNYIKICRNPFLYSGHFNYKGGHGGRGGGDLVAIPSFIQGISTLWGRAQGWDWLIMSQSLPLFRAFQQNLCWKAMMSSWTQSQSLPLFRAFQLITVEEGEIVVQPSRNPFLYSGHFNKNEVNMMRIENNWGRNPFLYSGHFNTSPSQDCREIKIKVGRNPFLYSGHFNSVKLTLKEEIYKCRNPFLYSGHFNINPWGAILFYKRKSQSLPLFRAFQQHGNYYVDSEDDENGRNPFLYSGHFNVEEGILNESLSLLSQSLPLFRAFQHSSMWWSGVISFQSQSLPLFRAFQHEIQAGEEA